MDRIERVRSLLSDLQPEFLDIIDESHMHGRGGVHTHLRVVIVSALFAGQSRVQRQRQIYDRLKAELDSELHALALRAVTPEEWRAEGAKDNFQSPPCQHAPSRKS